jgi:hypothetical protein
MRFLILLLILLLAPAAQGAVLEISDMKITVHVAEKAHFKYEITLRNLIDKPLVPGVSELRLQKVENPKFLIFPIPIGERRGEVDVENLKAYSGNMNFKSYYEKHGDYSSIYYEIWYPIEPLGERTVVVEFDADIVEKGLLFKSITFPVGSDIEVRNLQISISSDWNLCYREGDAKSIPANHIAFFTAEFSMLPLPSLPTRGYVLFWITVLALALAVLFVIRRL